MSKLLISEPPLQVLPSLAVKIGLSEAIVLQQLHYWLSNPKVGKEVDGKRWIYATYEKWKQDNFPFWSVSTIKRIFHDLEKPDENGEKLVLSEQFDKGNYNRQKYYRINYEKLKTLADTESSDQEGQIGPFVDSNLTPSLKTETSTESSVTTAKSAVNNSYFDSLPEPKYVPLQEKNKVKPNVYHIAKAIAEVTGQSFSVNDGRLMKVAGRIAKDERSSPEIIRRDYLPGGAWWTEHWLGKKNERPTAEQIAETLFTFGRVVEERIIKAPTCLAEALQRSK